MTDDRIGNRHPSTALRRQEAMKDHGPQRILRWFVAFDVVASATEAVTYPIVITVNSLFPSKSFSNVVQPSRMYRLSAFSVNKYIFSTPFSFARTIMKLHNCAPYPLPLSSGIVYTNASQSLYSFSRGTLSCKLT